jgi:hypothetical protein
MILKTEEDIRRLVKADEWMMQVLRAAESLNLPDWWIGAGFLRNKVWNAIEDNDSHSNSDVDLVYFDSNDIKPEADWAYDTKMKQDYPIADWEIRNQARMHYVNNFEPYVSTADGISNWVETATCTAVKLENGELKFLFCHGIDDLVDLVARPIPRFQSDGLIDVFNDRVEKKEWQKKWPHLKIKLK